MGFHYGYEKRKFDAEWTRLEQEYRAAGISKVQFEFVRQRFESISSAMADLLNQMERTINV